MSIASPLRLLSGQDKLIICSLDLGRKSNFEKYELMVLYSLGHIYYWNTAHKTYQE